MVDVEDLKKMAEAVTGIATPGADELDGLLRKSKLRAFRFKDDGFIPNHPTWPALIYPECVRLPKGRDPAAIFEALFSRNAWGRSWRGGVYDFVHYHSRTHEVLAVARGWVRLQLGGPKGRILRVKAGDVAVLPAGTGHQCLGASDDFLAVGAYPLAASMTNARMWKSMRGQSLLFAGPRCRNAIRFTERTGRFSNTGRSGRRGEQSFTRVIRCARVS